MLGSRLIAPLATVSVFGCPSPHPILSSCPTWAWLNDDMDRAPPAIYRATVASDAIKAMAHIEACLCSMSNSQIELDDDEL